MANGKKHKPSLINHIINHLKLIYYEQTNISSCI